MVISEGYFYHINDSYFELANEDTLMSNYENGGYRPHYLAIRDSENADIFWMVPVSYTPSLSDVESHRRNMSSHHK